YGERSVSQIVTFGTLGAKSVVRDVARVLGWSYGDADRLAKMIPGNPDMTLESAAAQNAELRALVENDETTRELWNHALRLEGLCRNAGMHAAGVVIGDRPLTDYIPLCCGKDNEVVTQFDMKALESLGMLKMDFLGLKTLTVIEAAVGLARRSHPEFRIEDIPLDDSEAFGIYNRGETIGVFQMESSGITAVCKRFDVRSLDDIIALGALYRPGPMQFIDDYIACKRGRKKPAYAHPLLEKVCADTYGIMVYQEQVQRAANVLAGYNLAQADLLRRAMGKKDASIMAREKARFIEGCGKVHGIPPAAAESIFEFIEKFAKYGFNKSHSAAYGLISYRTAYLKAHFPVEFMAAMLSHDAPDTERLSELVAECRRMGIRVLPPDINSGAAVFMPVEEAGGRAIRFGLASIKNVGSAAVEALTAERQRGGPFTSLENFCLRLDNRAVNRKTIESLVRCGAFDSLDSNRARLFARIEGAMAAAAGHQRDRSAGQAGLFDTLDFSTPTPAEAQADVAPWPISQTLAAEKELLGFYITGHPLEEYAGHFEGGKLTPLAEAAASEATHLKVGGIIASVEKKYTNKDKRPFLQIVLEDFSGSLEITAWDETQAKYASLLEPGAIVSASIKIQRRDGGAFRAQAGSFAKLKPKRSLPPVRLRLLREKLDSGILEAIHSAATSSPGERPLILEIEDQDGRVAELASPLMVRDGEAIERAAEPALPAFGSSA
ncbi:MAG: DNA polymerase III subunit alpha, partial [Terrimicrobiaceae bacterium]|nr:DNA polymerase III subunit alpha [Terrimicrobiaceae bacterium]